MLSSAYEYFLLARRIISVLLLDDKTCQIYVKHLNVFDNVLKPVEVFTHEVVGSEHAVGNAEFLCQDLFACCAPQVQNIKAPFPMIRRNAVDCDVASKL